MKEIRPRLYMEESLEKSIQQLARLHRRSFNDEIVVALEAYAAEERKLVAYKATTNLNDIWAMKHQLIDGKIIITAWITGRTVRVLVLGENEITKQKFIDASWHGWQNNHYIDIDPEDNIEFKIYTERQYAAMMDAARKKREEEK